MNICSFKKQKHIFFCNTKNLRISILQTWGKNLCLIFAIRGTVFLNRIKKMSSDIYKYRNSCAVNTDTFFIKSKAITFSVGLNNCHLALFPFLTFAMFTAKCAIIVHFIKRFKNVFVVDLTSSWFVSTWIIS